MIGQNYLIPVMAAAFMVINLLGAIFTISSVRSRRIQQANGPSPDAVRQLAKPSSSVLTARFANTSFGVFATIAGAVATVALVKVGQMLGLW
jgi:hypothetical protein